MPERDNFNPEFYQPDDPTGTRRPPPPPPRPARPAPRPAIVGASGPPPRLEEVVEKLVRALETHRAPIELLYMACYAAKLPMPGLAGVTLMHPRSQKGDEIVAYMTFKLAADASLARIVQVAVFRYYDAAAAVRAANRAIAEDDVPQPLLAQLRLKLHHLMHFHVEFKGDSVLRQLFPGPKTLPPPPPMSNAQRMKAKIKFENALHRAEALVVALEREMGLVAQVLAALSRRGGPDLLALTRREERDACLVAISLEHDGPAREKLREALRDFEGLKAAVLRARETQDPAGLESAAASLAGFRHACADHAVLRKLFPPAEAVAS